MTQRRLARIVSVIVLLSSIYSAVFDEAWFCEGRQCGITLWNCCCPEPEPSQHEKYRAPSPSVGEPQTVCASDCRCIMVKCVRVMGQASASDSDVFSSASTPPPAMVALHPVFPGACLPPVLVDTVSHRTETRGPPSRSFDYSRPSLRAPPTA